MAWVQAGELVLVWSDIVRPILVPRYLGRHRQLSPTSVGSGSSLGRVGGVVFSLMWTARGRICERESDARRAVVDSLG